MTIDEKYISMLKTALRFDGMLTPKIITFVYWLLLLGVFIATIGIIFSGEFLTGLGLLVGGCVFVRMWCELMIVLFKINENIQKITDRE